MLRNLLTIGALLMLCACGGGDGSGSPLSGSGGGGGNTGSGSNSVAVVVDGGPAALNTGPNPYTQTNVVYVSVTICAPGSTTNCQTIDHVQVDTGSVGLRIVQSVISSSLLSALPTQTDASGNPVGECYGYVDGYVFGSVRSADLTIGGEKVAGMPFQAVGDTGVFSNAPQSCTAGAGTPEDTVYALGANGIIGIGVTTDDCGTACTVAGGYSAAIYYDCPSSGCYSIIARNATTSAPFQQLPNPVAAMSVDNNGTLLSLPSATSSGQATLSGTLYFGIGTETNNGLGSATVLTATGSSNANGPGLITAVYSGQTLDESTIDSGSNFYIFVDNSLTQCTGTTYAGYYCPSSPLTLSATLEGLSGASATAMFTLNNAETLFNTNDAVLPGIGGDPDVFFPGADYPNSFDFGLPFFYGRNIYTAIEGRLAGGTTGPYFAF